MTGGGVGAGFVGCVDSAGGSGGAGGVTGGSMATTVMSLRQAMNGCRLRADWCADQGAEGGSAPCGAGPGPSVSRNPRPCLGGGRDVPRLSGWQSRRSSRGEHLPPFRGVSGLPASHWHRFFRPTRQSRSVLLRHRSVSSTHAMIHRGRGGETKRNPPLPNEGFREPFPNRGPDQQTAIRMLAKEDSKRLIRHWPSRWPIAYRLHQIEVACKPETPNLLQAISCPGRGLTHRETAPRKVR